MTATTTIANQLVQLAQCEQELASIRRSLLADLAKLEARQGREVMSVWILPRKKADVD